MQPEIEGVFVPLEAEQANDALVAWFTGPKYSGSGAMLGLDAEDADRIDEILRTLRPAGFAATVDRAQLRDSVEAWVHVVIHDEVALSLFSGFGPYPRSAVLTWVNSD
jgi:hypothetical protein